MPHQRSRRLVSINLLPIIGKFNHATSVVVAERKTGCLHSYGRRRSAARAGSVPATFSKSGTLAQLSRDVGEWPLEQ